MSEHVRLSKGWSDTTKATTFGIVYATESKMVLVIMLPDSDEDLAATPLREGTSLLICPKGASDLFTCQKLVEAATGVKPLHPRHAVVDENNNVVAVDMIEPTLDGHSVHGHGKRFVQSHDALVGMKHTHLTGFTK